jgi:hypothetical protein
MAESSKRRRHLVTAVIAGLVASVATAGVAHAVPPGNDSFAMPKDLAGEFGLVRASTVDASKEAGEPDHAGVLGNKSVWFKWTAPNARRVMFRTGVPEGVAFDSLLGVYRGAAVDALTVVASNDDASPGEWASEVAFQPESGATYLVAVDGVAGKSGQFGLSWAMRPSNNDFAAARAISEASGSIRADTSLATREADEARWHRRSVWYRWTAPRTGDVVFRTGGSLFDTVLGVYSGRSLDSARLLAQNDDTAEDATSRVRLRAVKGRTYRIVVAGFNGDSGPAVLRWRMS